MSKTCAFLFPGQGSQSVGMLRDYIADYRVIEQTFLEASKALNYNLLHLVEQGPEELLNQTAYTQPALLTASVAIWRVWQEKHGKQPAIMAGHSLGEYSALVCADALEFEQAVMLVAKRGEYMQEAMPEGEGAMAAILGLSDEQVANVCETAAQDQIVAPVNFNCPGQVVIAGHQDAVDRALHLAKTTGAKLAKKLPVSVPSHCLLMRSAADKLATYLENIKISAPKIPVVNNVDVAVYSDANEIKNALIRQLYNPVRWVETIETIALTNVGSFLECGPGKVLTGLNKRIVTNIPTYALETPTLLQEALTVVV